MLHSVFDIVVAILIIVLFLCILVSWNHYILQQNRRMLEWITGRMLLKEGISITEIKEQIKNIKKPEN